MSALPVPPPEDEAPRMPELPAVWLGTPEESWALLQKHAPAGTAQMLAEEVIGHRQKSRPGVMKVLVKYDKHGQWYETEVKPAKRRASHRDLLTRGRPKS